MDRGWSGSKFMKKNRTVYRWTEVVADSWTEAVADRWTEVGTDQWTEVTRLFRRTSREDLANHKSI